MSYKEAIENPHGTGICDQQNKAHFIKFTKHSLRLLWHGP